MITTETVLQDWLLAQPRVSGTGLPYVLPTVSRTHLPKLCNGLGFTKGAEIGVWRGAYSATFCEANPELHMLCVDPWEPHADWIDTKNAMPREKAKAFMQQAYKDALAKLVPLNTTILKMYSVAAADMIPDGSLDFCYIDANHVLGAVTADLMAWAPKVRSGGWIGGHDFRQSDNKPFIQVIPAVTAYTKANEIDPWFALAAERTSSWLWVVR